MVSNEGATLHYNSKYATILSNRCSGGNTHTHTHKSFIDKVPIIHELHVKIICRKYRNHSKFKIGFSVRGLSLKI